MKYSTEPIPTVQENGVQVQELGIPTERFLAEVNETAIIELLKKVNRVGIDALIEYLCRETDFFTAPASTKYHGNYLGGLASHSLNVYEILCHKNTKYDLGLSEETMILTALLHDLCKVNFYTIETKAVLNGKIEVEKNKKINGTWVQVKEMVNNWEDQDVYTVKDTFPVGHGEKSVFLILKYIQLTDQEIAMIRWHMGFSNCSDTRALDNAMKMYPAVVALHTADMEESYFMSDTKG